MTADTARADKLVQAAQDASPGQEIHGLFLVQTPELHDTLVPPRRQRPRVLQQSEVSSAPWSKVGNFLGTLLTLDFKPPKKSLKLPSSVEARAGMRRKSTGTSNLDEVGCHAFGAEGSHASQLLVAAFPRSNASVQMLLCVTANDLKLLYVPYARRMRHYANVVEVGAQVDRRALEWTRSTAWKRGNQGIQYGFTDGSWVSFFTFAVAGQPDFTDVFPQTLTKEDPIPPNANYPEPEPGI